MKKEKPEVVDELPVAPPEPTDEELIERRNAALAEYGLTDARALPESNE